MKPRFNKGDIINVTTPLLSGWTGRGIVIECDENTVRFRKEGTDDSWMDRRCFCMVHEAELADVSE